jgi:hypothetical protein
VLFVAQRVAIGRERYGPLDVHDGRAESLATPRHGQERSHHTSGAAQRPGLCPARVGLMVPILCGARTRSPLPRVRGVDWQIGSVAYSATFPVPGSSARTCVTGPARVGCPLHPERQRPVASVAGRFFLELWAFDQRTARLPLRSQNACAAKVKAPTVKAGKAPLDCSLSTEQASRCRSRS